VDLDNDGDLDLVTLDMNDKPQILRSNLSESAKINYAKITLQGINSNRNAIGATVVVKSGEKTLTRFVDGKSGYLAQSVTPLYFGLGESSKIDSISVNWPSGKRQTLTTDIELNRLINIQEPSQ
jgi:enediyne biosynthesis protein E4